MRPTEDPDAEQARIDALFVAIFEDDKRGAEVFEVLYKRYAAHAKVHTDGGIDAILKTYRSAAHRELLDHIVIRCNRARGVTDEPDQP
jgi:hypothetical protein